MIILGISAFYHDAAAVILKDGEIIAAHQEERFTRKKHDPSFPEKAILACLKKANIKKTQISYVAFHDKASLKFHRILSSFSATTPKAFNNFLNVLTSWLFDKRYMRRKLFHALKGMGINIDKEKILFGEHHQSHAASAFFASPFERSAIITMDGVGEWNTTSIALGEGNKITPLKEINFPHSIGLLYSAFTSYLGFRVNTGEYKVMGLAPYGNPKYKDLILENIISLKEDGSFWIDMSYMGYLSGQSMFTSKFCKLFGAPPRRPDVDELQQFHMDIAASIQAVTEDIVIKIARQAINITGCKNICLAGGVALNCVANGKILEQDVCAKLWAQPAAGDAGGALGAALSVWHSYLKKPRKIDTNDSMKGAYLGISFTDDEIKKYLDKVGALYKHKSTLKEYIKTVSQYIQEGKVVGWFQGPMEFGPRALGNRSIIADPRNSEMQRKLNLKIKFRESFRPFAPAILEEKAHEWFDLKQASPYMLVVSNVLTKHQIPHLEKYDTLFGLDLLNQKRSSIPSVTHVNYSARVQTISERTNPLFHALICHFENETGCPIVINTSFNVRGEPIVCSPQNAFECFMGTGMDILAIGNFILKKEEQPKTLIKNYEHMFELD